MILIYWYRNEKPAPLSFREFSTMKSRFFAVELVFRIHLLVMSLKGKAYEEAPLVLCIVLQIA